MFSSFLCFFPREVAIDKLMVEEMDGSKNAPPMSGKGTSSQLASRNSLDFQPT